MLMSFGGWFFIAFLSQAGWINHSAQSSAASFASGCECVVVHLFIPFATVSNTHFSQTTNKNSTPFNFFFFLIKQHSTLLIGFYYVWWPNTEHLVTQLVVVVSGTTSTAYGYWHIIVHCCPWNIIISHCHITCVLRSEYENDRVTWCFVATKSSNPHTISIQGVIAL